MTGLNNAQVQQRLKDGLSNVVTAKAGLTEGQIILRHTVTFFNLVFVVLAAVAIWNARYAILNGILNFILNLALSLLPTILVIGLIVWAARSLFRR